MSEIIYSTRKLSACISALYFIASAGCATCLTNQREERIRPRLLSEHQFSFATELDFLMRGNDWLLADRSQTPTNLYFNGHLVGTCEGVHPVYIQDGGKWLAAAHLGTLIRLFTDQGACDADKDLLVTDQRGNSVFAFSRAGKWKILGWPETPPTGEITLLSPSANVENPIFVVRSGGFDTLYAGRVAVARESQITLLSSSVEPGQFAQVVYACKDGQDMYVRSNNHSFGPCDEVHEIVCAGSKVAFSCKIGSAFRIVENWRLKLDSQDIPEVYYLRSDAKFAYVVKDVDGFSFTDGLESIGAGNLVCCDIHGSIRESALIFQGEKGVALRCGGKTISIQRQRPFRVMASADGSCVAVASREADGDWIDVSPGTSMRCDKFLAFVAGTQADEISVVFRDSGRLYRQSMFGSK